MSYFIDTQRRMRVDKQQRMRVDKQQRMRVDKQQRMRVDKQQRMRVVDTKDVWFMLMTYAAFVMEKVTVNGLD